MNKKLTYLIAFFIFLFFQDQALSQDERRNHGNVIAPHFQFGGNIFAGDISDRFGNTLNFGTGVDYMLEKGNWIIGVKGDYFFGNEVKENVFSVIAPEGVLFGEGGTYSDVALKSRGFYVGGHIGKIFPLSSVDKRSGIRLTLGAGMLQHQIRVQQDPNNFAAQIREDYSKGYDRLTNGLALRQFIGYQHLGKDQFINFTAGIEIIEGFTKNRRSFNFNEMARDNQKRLDIVIGIKLGWTLPFYIGESTGEIYY